MPERLNIAARVGTQESDARVPIRCCVRAYTHHTSVSRSTARRCGVRQEQVVLCVVYKQITKSTCLTARQGRADLTVPAPLRSRPRPPSIQSPRFIFYSIKALIYCDGRVFGRSVCISNQFYSFRRAETHTIRK